MNVQEFSIGINILNILKGYAAICDLLQKLQISFCHFGLAQAFLFASQADKS
jgi:hypothetical protein